MNKYKIIPESSVCSLLDELIQILIDGKGRWDCWIAPTVLTWMTFAVSKNTKYTTSPLIL